MQPHSPSDVMQGPRPAAGPPGAYILVVDDEPDIRNLLQEILEDEGYQVAVAENGNSARAARRAQRPDLVLLDIWMPDVDGISLLKEWSEEGAPAMPVIMMSGHGTVETAVEATRLGAYDYIEKPLSLAKLLLTIERALEAAKLQRENLGLRRQTHTVVEPVGKSPPMQRLREQVRRIAQHDTWVLITGEAGSGRKVAARYLHASSGRRDGPFIDASMASLAGGDAAVELFGSEHDGRIRYGLLEQANGGTLLLDEVGEMDLASQAKLLAALESRTFYRVGGTEPVRINVRVIAATRYDLAQHVEQGQFRKDLFYQLNVVPLNVPALREHCEDVPDLLTYYVDLFVTRDRLPYRNFSVAAQNRLRNYDWPGNVRELKNLVQRLLIIGAGAEIEAEEVEAALRSGAAERSVPGVPVSLEQPLREARDEFERAYLEYHLRRSGGSVGKVAQVAGMERTHLYRKLRALGIDIKTLSYET